MFLMIDKIPTEGLNICTHCIEDKRRAGAEKVREK